MSLWPSDSIQSSIWEHVRKRREIEYYFCLGQEPLSLDKELHLFLILSSVNNFMYIYYWNLWNVRWPSKICFDLVSSFLKTFKIHLLFKMSRALLNILKYNFNILGFITEQCSILNSIMIPRIWRELKESQEWVIQQIAQTCGI